MKAFKEYPLLVSPDYTKDIMGFHFYSEYTMGTFLLQNIKYGYEQPIAFFNRALRDTKLKCNIMEKKAFFSCIIS